jgi:hypothetical protein
MYLIEVMSTQESKTNMAFDRDIINAVHKLDFEEFNFNNLFEIKKNAELHNSLSLDRIQQQLGNLSPKRFRLEHMIKLANNLKNCGNDYATTVRKYVDSVKTTQASTLQDDENYDYLLEINPTDLKNFDYLNDLLELIKQEEIHLGKLYNKLRKERTQRFNAIAKELLDLIKEDREFVIFKLDARAVVNIELASYED